jgi:hypothetical protein
MPAKKGIVAKHHPRTRSGDHPVPPKSSVDEKYVYYSKLSYRLGTLKYFILGV